MQITIIARDARTHTKGAQEARGVMASQEKNINRS